MVDPTAPSPTNDTTWAVLTAIRAWNDGDTEGATLVLDGHDQPTVIAELLSCCVTLGRAAAGNQLQDTDAFTELLGRAYNMRDTGQA